MVSGAARGQATLPPRHVVDRGRDACAVDAIGRVAVARGEALHRSICSSAISRSGTPSAADCSRARRRSSRRVHQPRVCLDLAVHDDQHAVARLLPRRGCATKRIVLFCASGSSGPRQSAWSSPIVGSSESAASACRSPAPARPLLQPFTEVTDWPGGGPEPVAISASEIRRGCSSRGRPRMSAISLRYACTDRLG